MAKTKNNSWKNYFIFSKSDDDRIKGYCKLCKKYYKDNNGVYSNFLKYLRRKHKSEYKMCNDSDITNDPKTSIPSSNKTRQNRINMALAKNLIIKCNLPLNIVENCAFRDFMNECNVKWLPISSKRLKSEYISFFNEKVNKALREKLNTVNYITITVDSWSDRKCRSFIGVSAHFLNAEHEPQTYLIDFVRIKSPHTGDKIQSLTEEILDHNYISLWVAI